VCGGGDRSRHWHTGSFHRRSAYNTDGVRRQCHGANPASPEHLASRLFYKLGLVPQPARPELAREHLLVRLPLGRVLRRARPRSRNARQFLRRALNRPRRRAHPARSQTQSETGEFHLPANRRAGAKPISHRRRNCAVSRRYTEGGKYRCCKRSRPPGPDDQFRASRPPSVGRMRGCLDCLRRR
jgi:hypothetical protein